MSLSLTKEDVIQELDEVRKDLRALFEARDCLQRRINDMEGLPRQDKFTSWAAVQILMNAFVMTTVTCEGLIEDYSAALEKMEAPAAEIIKLISKSEERHDG